MLDPNQKTELIRLLEAKKKELDSQRSKVESLYQQKEQCFNSKKQLHSSITEKIAKVRALRKQRDDITQEVKSHKTKRDDTYSIIKEKLAEIKSTEQRHKDPRHKEAVMFKPKNPEYIKQQIDELELKIETEGMSFDKEQKMMKRIKELKKEYKESSEAYELWKKKNAVSAEVGQLQQEALLHHKVTQEKAKHTHSIHEQIVSLSKEIDELKKKGSELNNKFLELKSFYAVEQQKLKQLQTEMTSMHQQLDEDRKDRVVLRERDKKKFLEEKKKEVEEKIKKGKGVKLTMEDLLAYQSAK